MPATRQPRISVSVGPGQHAQQLLSSLGRQGLLEDAFRSWPSFTIERWNPDLDALEQVWTSPAYATLVRLVWAAWRKIPAFGRHPTPRAFLYSVFDRAVARRLGRIDLFVGWSQQALHSLRAARNLGAITVLEHPMLHVELWQETMEEEYRRYAPDTEEYYSLLPRSLVRRMLAEYGESDLIVVPSSVAGRTFTDRGIAAGRVVVIPLAVDTRPFEAVSPRTRAKGFRVLYIGRLELLKGVQYLLEAWRALGLKDAELVLAGPVLPEMARCLTRFHDPSVRVLGEVEHGALPRLLESCDAVVFPSICDAFGLVIIEAMAAGRPVIATDRSGAPDIISDGEGFVVPARDTGALADRLAWLHEHVDDRFEIGRRARLKATACYGLSRYRADLVKAYTRALVERGQARATAAGG